MRTAFIFQLIEEAKSNDKIFLLVADLGFSVIEPFAEQFPERYLNVGIAEQNMAGIAAGLAMEGYCVYIYSIGNFPTLRCMEQIRYDICYHNLNVKIVAVGGGYAYGALGPSHHTTEEVGMLRVIPNMVVCCPGDPAETRVITTFTTEHQGPCYIRLGKAGEPEVHTNGKVPRLAAGDFLQVQDADNNTVAVFSTGGMLKYAFDFINENKQAASLYSFPFVKPVNAAKLLPLLKRFDRIITIEEHQLNCGFGAAVLEIINDAIENGSLQQAAAPQVKRVGINDTFYSKAGSQQFLRKLAGIQLTQDFFIQNNQ